MIEIDWMQKQEISFPTSIRFGAGVAKELIGYLKDQKLSDPLIVTDATCSKLPFFEEIVAPLRKSGMHFHLFDEVHTNPIKSDVMAAVKLFRNASLDTVIGVGGGASIDVAKAVALMAFHPGDLFDYEENKGGAKLVTKELPELIALPTTSGTGSEVGRSSVISDDLSFEKKIIFSPRLMPKRVFADPLLTMKLPPHITAATGVDALTHAIEAFVSKGYHPMCDGIAMEAVRLCFKYLRKATFKPDLESRSQMMMASMMAAVAFQKGLGIVHSTAHPLSSLYQTHHGLANAIMLRFGLQFNASVAQERYEILGRLIKSRDFIKSTSDLLSSLDLPYQLRSVGVREVDLPKLAQLALNDPCHRCNPREVTESDFLQL